MYVCLRVEVFHIASVSSNLIYTLRDCVWPISGKIFHMRSFLAVFEAHPRTFRNMPEVDVSTDETAEQR